MREPGAVLLISCYELGHQPFGLALPLGFLERAGFSPAALDVAVEPLDEAAVARARVVGISVPMHTALRLGVRVAERVRRVNPGCHVCFYGLYASLNAGYLLAHGADSVVGGEVEATLVALVEALERGEPAEAVAGVATRRRPAAPVLARLPFARPSRRGLPPLDRYARLERGDGRAEVAGYVEASRGCRHLCRHCPIPPVYGGRFFVLPRELVLEDIRQQVAAGATHITFGDPDFLNGPGHALRLVRALHAEFPHVTFDVTAKIEHILRHRALFPELARAGCAFVVSAVESLNDAVLANLEKGHTRADVLEALAVLRGAGLPLRPSFVPFTPWETLESYGELFDFVEREELVEHVDPVQYTIRLLVPPGSRLLDQPAMRPFLGPLDEGAFTYRWTHPDPRMDRLQQAASRLVEAAAAAGEAPALTFARLRALARAAREGGEAALAAAA
ncbi:MAG TPA: CUAEP/CCAEP-tail radical SAM protein, partial [Thermodesulfobacteriota bacterium]|nr:CUAEP/CCAEP-tail radical SAM protein [Thermodesulfobacteriota bacterium]